MFLKENFSVLIKDVQQECTIILLVILDASFQLSLATNVMVQTVKMLEISLLLKHVLLEVVDLQPVIIHVSLLSKTVISATGILVARWLEQFLLVNHVQVEVMRRQHATTCADQRLVTDVAVVEVADSPVLDLIRRWKQRTHVHQAASLLQIVITHVFKQLVLVLNVYQAD